MKCIITLDSQSSRCPSSDNGNASNKSSSNSSGSKQTAEKLREYRVRKLKRLVDKCHRCKIYFPDCFVNLSSCFAKDPSSLNDDEIIELMAECNQSLDSDEEENRSDSSSDSSSGRHPKKMRRRGVLTPSKKETYNQAWSSRHHFNAATMGTFPRPLSCNKLLFPVNTPHPQQQFRGLCHFHPAFLQLPSVPYDATLHYHYSSLLVHQPVPTNYGPEFTPRVITGHPPRQQEPLTLHHEVETINQSAPNRSFTSTPCASQVLTPTPSEDLCSPHMSSTPVPHEEMTTSSVVPASPCKDDDEHYAVINSVDGTNNGNKSDMLIYFIIDIHKINNVNIIHPDNDDVLIFFFTNVYYKLVKIINYFYYCMCYSF